MAVQNRHLHKKRFSSCGFACHCSWAVVHSWRVLSHLSLLTTRNCDASVKQTHRRAHVVSCQLGICFSPSTDFVDSAVTSALKRKRPVQRYRRRLSPRQGLSWSSFCFSWSSSKISWTAFPIWTTGMWQTASKAQPPAGLPLRCRRHACLLGWSLRDRSIGSESRRRRSRMARRNC